MKEIPIWLDNIIFEKQPQLDKDLEVDVLIIGGGITGLSTAFYLKDSNLNIVLVEKNQILHGITSKTTGKLNYLQDNIYSKLKEKSRLYYDSQKEAIKLVEENIKKYNIDCNYKVVNSFLYSDDNYEEQVLNKEIEMLSILGVNYKVIDKLPINTKCKRGVVVNDTAIFHPVKYLNTLKDIIISSGIKIYESSTVTKIEKENDEYICLINNKKVTAKKVVIATNYPFFVFPFLTPLKTTIEKSYLSASKIKIDSDFQAITISPPSTSLRTHIDKDKYLLVLKENHNISTKYNYEDNFNKLLESLKQLNLTPEYIWSNHDIITEDHLPYIGYIKDNMLIGTGYNTWGMTNGTIAGKIISDLILNKDNKYKELFDPKRNIKLTNKLNYILNISYSLKSIVENKIIKNKSWYKKIFFTKINGDNVGIYIDENKKRHIVYNKCPHLKCSLIFNEVEKTWDCPCHGSRYNVDGICITGPSNYNISYKNLI